NLGRYEEALQREGARTTPTEIDPFSHIYHFRRSGILHALRGDASQAFADFEYALATLKNTGIGFRRIVVSGDYAHWAMALGRLDIAMAQYERALFIARDRSAKWRIPFFALQLANALTTAGDYEGSRHILADIVTRDTETPILRVLRSIVTFQLG